ncbi:MAG TPA: 30S ribosomal protein S8 [Candidatus Sulfotelmatobacter sp.]|nr:30S ribosomal protein S8 [Candidatus Sulfotelmatobacter sp.]
MSTTTTDPIADMLTRIRNSMLVRKNEIVLPHSNLKESVAKILKEAKFIDDVSSEKDGQFKNLKIKINADGTNPRISEIVRISSPGRRTYVNSKEIPTIKHGRGIVIISTSKGLMTGDQAKHAHVGGELICKVY